MNHKDLKVGAKITWWGLGEDNFATITELTINGFKYKLDKSIWMTTGHNGIHSIQSEVNGGEVYDDRFAWELKETKTPRWTVKWGNDVGDDDDYYVEWWDVTDGEKIFKCDDEKHAVRLCNFLNEANFE